MRWALFKVHIFWEGHKNFAKSSPNFWLQYIRSKVRERFRKILWPSQNIWTLKKEEKKLAVSYLRLYLTKIPRHYVSWGLAIDCLQIWLAINIFYIIFWKVMAIDYYSRNYMRSKARKIWRSWKMKAKFWSIWILHINNEIEDWMAPYPYFF